MYPHPIPAREPHDLANSLTSEETSTLLGIDPPIRAAPVGGWNRIRESQMGTTPPLDHPKKRIDSFDSPRELATDADIQFRIQAVYEEFADRLRQTWTRPMRGGLHVRCANVRDNSFGGVILGMDTPTCAHVFAIPPLEGRALLEIPSSFALALLDRLLGGGTQTSTLSRRPLTELERRLLLRLSSPLMQVFSNALQGGTSQRAELERVESNPRVIRCFNLAEPMLVGRVTISLPATSGEIRLAIPRRVMLQALHSEIMSQQGEF